MTMTPEEAKTWQPRIIWMPLASRVIAAAKSRIEGKWAAYCDAVPGIEHRKEFIRVLEYGDKLAEWKARALFPEFKDLPYAD